MNTYFIKTYDVDTGFCLSIKMFFSFLEMLEEYQKEKSLNNFVKAWLNNNIVYKDEELDFIWENLNK